MAEHRCKDPCFQPKATLDGDALCWKDDDGRDQGLIVNFCPWCGERVDGSEQAQGFRFRDLDYRELAELEELFNDIECDARSAAIGVDNDKPWRAEAEVDDIEKHIAEIKRRFGRTEPPDEEVTP